MRYSPSLVLASVLASDLGGVAVPVGGQGAGLAYCRCARVLADSYGLFIRRTRKGLEVVAYPLDAGRPEIAWPAVSVPTDQPLAAQAAAVHSLLADCLPLAAWLSRKEAAEAEAKAREDAIKAEAKAREEEARARVAPLLEAMEAARIAALAATNEGAASNADD